MGKYIHLFQTQQEYEDFVKGKTESISGLTEGGYGFYTYEGINPNTGRYVWKSSEDIMETLTQMPDIANGFTAYFFYDNSFHEYECGAGDFQITTGEKKIKSQYIRPWLSFTKESSGVGYNIKYEAIDLGLSVLWATCNVKAFSPEDYGGYFAWGETFEKDIYAWSNYTLGGDADSPNKYAGYYGWDKLSRLELVDDAANVIMGGNWRIPTEDEFYELFDGTNIADEILNGVNGIRLTSKTDQSKSIFIPKAGMYYNSDGPSANSPILTGELCVLWSAEQMSYPWMAGHAAIDSESQDVYAIERQWGIPVRGVMDKN